MLSSYLLGKLRVPPTALLAVTDSVRRTLPVVSAVIQGADGGLWPPAKVPAAFNDMLNDYRLVQYDLLLGEQFSIAQRAALRSDSMPGQGRR
jgi:hypothetical protein